MAKVFVTRGTGFIGTELIRRLVERGDQVTCLLRPGSSTARAARIAQMQQLGVRMHAGDICELESIAPAVARADVVFNVGGVTIARRLEDFFAGNRDGVRNLLTAASRRSSPPVVVHVSTLAAAGVSPRGNPRDENGACLPVSNYGRSKLAGEQVAQQFADRVPVTVVRPPMVLGQGDTVSLELFKSIVNWRLHVAPGRQTREYSVVHVSDLVEVLLRAADRGERMSLEASRAEIDIGQLNSANLNFEPANLQFGSTRQLNSSLGNQRTAMATHSRPLTSNRHAMPGRYEDDVPTSIAGQGVYYAAAPNVYSYAELGHLMAEAMDCPRIRVLRLPDRMLWTAAAISQLAGKLRGKPAFLNLDKAREATAGHWTCQPTKSQQQLGFAISVPLVDRLRETYAWYCEQKWL